MCFFFFSIEKAQMKPLMNKSVVVDDAFCQVLFSDNWHKLSRRCKIRVTIDQPNCFANIWTHIIEIAGKFILNVINGHWKKNQIKWKILSLFVYFNYKLFYPTKK